MTSDRRPRISKSATDEFEATRENLICKPASAEQLAEIREKVAKVKAQFKPAKLRTGILPDLFQPAWSR